MPRTRSNVPSICEAEKPSKAPSKCNENEFYPSLPKNAQHTGFINGSRAGNFVVLREVLLCAFFSGARRTMKLGVHCAFLEKSNLCARTIQIKCECVKKIRFYFMHFIPFLLLSLFMHWLKSVVSISFKVIDTSEHYR